MSAIDEQTVTEVNRAAMARWGQQRDDPWNAH
jgi:hypothetical protein